jgi:small conductance mechanosensitive channel
MPEHAVEETANRLLNTDWLGLYVLPWGTRILLALLILLVGRWVARRITRLAERAMERVDVDAMLVRFLGNLIYFALLVVVVLAALEQLGVNTTSALAVFGAAGLAVGLALQKSLSNFAAGSMLIFFRPFKAGDFVEVAGIGGVVEEVRVFNTVLRTHDNREIIVPNGQIYEDKIVNYSARDTRRIDLVFGIGYDDDLKKAKALIEEILAADERILDDPAPFVAVVELGESSVDIAVRPWVRSGDYGAVRSDLLEGIKAAFDANGITIPYPTRDIHLHTVSDPAV